MDLLTFWNKLWDIRCFVRYPFQWVYSLHDSNLLPKPTIALLALGLRFPSISPPSVEIMVYNI